MWSLESMRSRKSEGAGWRETQERWTREDGAAMVAAFELSGTSMRRFAEQHGLAVQRVAYWRAKLAEPERATPPSGGFAAVRIADEPAVAIDRSVEVRLRNGRALTIRGGWDETTIRTWVRALEAVS